MDIPVWAAVRRDLAPALAGWGCGVARLDTDGEELAVLQIKKEEEKKRGMGRICNGGEDEM